MALIKLHVTVENAGLAAITMATNKYNKPFFFAQQFDDGAFEGWRNLMAIWEANGHYMTDGCGNNILYSAEVGVTIDTGAAEHFQDMAYVINGGGAVSNHSAYHNEEDPEGQTLILDREVINVMGYRMSTFIIPVDYPGFARAAAKLKYRGITSEGDYFDEYNNQRHYRLIPADPIFAFDAFIRDLRDQLDDPGVFTFFKSQVDLFFNEQANFYIWASHSNINTDALKAGIKSMYDYLFTVAEDRVLMCTLREFLDYRTMRTAPITQQVNGNIITVSFDTANLNDRTSWFDICLNVTGSKITGVTTEGFESTTFNTDSGLVNGFLKKTIWPDEETPPVLDPIQDLYVTHGKFIVE